MSFVRRRLIVLLCAAFWVVVPRAHGDAGLRVYRSFGVTHAPKLGYIDWADYDLNSTVSDVNFAYTNGAFVANGPENDFALRLVGRIDIPDDGVWIFSLGSDETAVLLIDEMPVVTDTTRHGFRWKVGTVSLTEGVHDFRVLYRERYYSAGFVVTWKGPNDALESVIPASAFEQTGSDSDRRVVQWREISPASEEAQLQDRRT